MDMGELLIYSVRAFMPVFVTYLEFVSPLTVKYCTTLLGFEGAVV